jgi:hypothetical protein
MKKRIMRKKATAKRKALPTEKTDQNTVIESNRREELIAAAAYARAESREFSPGHELEDWLEAEKEVDAAISDQKTEH